MPLGERWQNLYSWCAMRIVYDIKELVSVIKSENPSIYNSKTIEIKNVKIAFNLSLKELFIKLDCLDSNRIEKTICFNEIECSDIKISGLKFTKEFTIRTSNVDKLWINECSFKSSFFLYNFAKQFKCVEIYNSKFHNSAKFSFCNREVVDNICIQDCKFNKNLLISGVTILKEKELRIDERTIVNQKIEISDCPFIFGDIYISCKVGCGLYFDKINFLLNEKNIDKKSRFGHLCIYNSEIPLLSFRRCILNTIAIDKSYIKDIDEGELYYGRIKEETAKFFIASPTICSNPIKRDKYLAEFYDNYYTQNQLDFLNSIAKKSDKYKFWEKSRLKNFFYELRLFLMSLILAFTSSERFTLFLYKYSNNFNRSWLRGLIFTSVVALIFYFLINYFGTTEPFFVVDWKFNDFGKVFSNYLYLLDIFNVFEQKNYASLNPFGQLLYFIAKIFIAYGSWQTVYAFYKKIK